MIIIVISISGSSVLSCRIDRDRSCQRLGKDPAAAADIEAIQPGTPYRMVCTATVGVASTRSWLFLCKT